MADTRHAPDPATDPATDNVLLRELARTWRHLNKTFFHDGMRPPAFALGEGEVQVGLWRPTDRSITLARSLLHKHPWTVVIEVLKHEMAHQYVHEVLGVRDETAHGPAFRRICDRLGIDARARGLPVEGSMDPVRAKALDKIRRLLALAESDNQHEAEAAMARAHRLMRKHNIAWAEEAAEKRHAFRQVGQPRARLPAHERILAGLLTKHFFVEAIWVWVFDADQDRDLRCLELCGSPENLELAAYVHAFLLRTADRLYAAHRDDPTTRTGRGSKGRFFSGLMLGFGDKLDAQARQCEQEEGLVWVGDPDLDDYVGRRHPRLRTLRSTRVVTDDAFQHGRAAGRNIVLHKPVAQHGGSRGRLLEDRQ